MAQVLTYGSPLQIFTLGFGEGSRLHDQVSQASTLDAAGEKYAFIGRVCLAGRAGSKTISSGGGKIHAYLSSSTFDNAGTSLDVGVQDVVTPPDVDGTFDTKGTFVGGTDTLTAGQINSFAMETGTKTITHGDVVAVVFDMTARGGTDSIAIGTLSSTGGGRSTIPYSRFHNGTSWGLNARWPNVLLEFDDGSFGWFVPFGFRPFANGSVSFNSGTSDFDEYGARIKLPWPADLIGLSVPITIGSTSDFELCVYSDIAGTPTLLATATTFDADLWGSSSAMEEFAYLQFDTAISLSAGQVYGWTIRPTTANSISLYHVDFGSGNNAKMASLPMGVESYRIKRLDNTGAFTLEDTIHVPHILNIDKLAHPARPSYHLGI